MTQERQIFVVRADVVDANGAFNPLSGYPKSFDSKTSPYNGDIGMCLDRAKAEWHDAVSAMLKSNVGRQLQTAVLMTADGRIIETFHKGAIAPVVIPDPEPNEEPEET